MKLNEKISYYRKAAKLSQEELAERTGVSRQAVSKWELGAATPELEKLVALAKTFGVTTDELLGLAEPRRETEQAPPQAPAQPLPEDVDWVLRRSARFRRWYTPIFVGLIMLAMGIWMCINFWGYHSGTPFVEKTMQPVRYASAAMAVLGMGELIWGVVRLILHRRKENKTASP